MVHTTAFCEYGMIGRLMKTLIARSYPDLIVLGVIYILILLTHWRKEGFRNCILHTCLYFSMCAVFLFTLMPFINDISNLFDGVKTGFNFIPFVDAIHNYAAWDIQIIENILLFVPFGFFHCFFGKHPYRNTMFAGMLLTLTVELIQPFLSTYRIFDVTDLITNTLGALVGILLFKLIMRKHK